MSDSFVAPAGFYKKPFLWLVLGLGLLYVPAIGYFADSGMEWNDIHPAINAMLNGTSTVFLIVGFYAIKKRDIDFHRNCMLAAFFASAVFLASYLTRFAISGTHRYPGSGWDQWFYFTILFSHMILAVALVPLCLRSIYLGLKDRRADHVRITKWAWPIWMYVSLTGVIVYLMLYPIANAVYGN